jgi:hypothetical protein
VAANDTAKHRIPYQTHGVKHNLPADPLHHREGFTAPWRALDMERKNTEEWLKSLAQARSRTGVNVQWLARKHHWTRPDLTEKYGPEWDGWAKGRPGDRELPPIVDPGAAATLPRTRLDEMHARGHLTGTEYALAVMFQERPCGASVLKGYYNVVVGIVLHGRAAGELADPRVARAKGIDEVMGKLRVGLRQMADHYLPDDEAGIVNTEAADRFRQTDFYKGLQQRELAGNEHYDPARNRGWSHAVGRLPDSRNELARLLPRSIDNLRGVATLGMRRPNWGGPKWRGAMAQKLWSAQMHRSSGIMAAWRAMPKKRQSMLADGAGEK